MADPRLQLLLHCMHSCDYQSSCAVRVHSSLSHGVFLLLLLLLLRVCCLLFAGCCVPTTTHTHRIVLSALGLLGSNTAKARFVSLLGLLKLVRIRQGQREIM